MDRDPGYFGITLKFEQYEKIDLFYIRITRGFVLHDKGNYTYQEVNTLDVSLNKVYSVRLDKDTTVTIIPQLSQSLQENEDNLEYTWLHSTTNHNFYGHGKFDTVGLEQNLNFHIDPEAKNLAYAHYFRLNVYDRITDIEYPVNTTIELIKPYVGSWMILHRKNGQTELGSVEYIGGDIVVQEDAYYEETGKRFTGKTAGFDVVYDFLQVLWYRIGLEYVYRHYG